ncbi:MAG: hypothetical protein MR821_04395 [Clostridiales bacterium]|nr:hypothetical protein [Clostridiales bacterium]
MGKLPGWDNYSIFLLYMPNVPEGADESCRQGAPSPCLMGKTPHPPVQEHSGKEAEKNFGKNTKSG